MNPIQNFYNNPYFENLKETKPFLEYLKAEEQRLRRTIHGGRVLDVGCGSGRGTIILADKSKEVVGVDFSERLLRQAKERLVKRDNVKLYLEDARSLHFEDNYFDNVIMLWNTFGNLGQSRDKVLKEAIRVLKPKRKIYLSVFSENVLSSYLEMLRKNNLKAELIDDNYVFLEEGLISERFSKEKLENIFSNFKLKSKIKELTNITYWCELEK